MSKNAKVFLSGGRKVLENYDLVIEQMHNFGLQLVARDKPLKLDTAKRVTCGLKGKYWYQLYEFRPTKGGSFITGAFGSYKTGECVKVKLHKKYTEADKKAMAAARAAREEKSRIERERLEQMASLRSLELWRRAKKQGTSEYLDRKRVRGEACRYLFDGSILVPMLRYDQPQHAAFVGVQRIFANGTKSFAKDSAVLGAALRLSQGVEDYRAVLICEGYSTALSLRMACKHRLAVYVGWNAGNIEHVLHILLSVHPHSNLLLCADDDWQTKDHDGTLKNVGRKAAWESCKYAGRLGRVADMIYPIFPASRGAKDTDFNDLHVLAGLDTIKNQLSTALSIRGVHIDD